MNTLELEALDRSLARHGFERFEAIGRGVETTVFLCKQVENGHELALKWWPADPGNPAREADLTTYLQNLKSRSRDRTPPHCVPIRAVAPKRRCVLMNRMRADLAAFRGGVAMEPDTAAMLLRQSLECLHRMHGRGALHGALKPTNVFVDRHGHFALSDSRYVKINSNGLVEDTVWLNLHDPFRTSSIGPSSGNVKRHSQAKYRSPESINPEFGPMGVWGDQFMLGFMAFELILGLEKFDRLFPGVGQEAMDVELGWLRWHGSRERMPSPYDVLPDLDSGLKNLIHRMTRKEVNKRFSDVKAAIQALMQDSKATACMMPGISGEVTESSVEYGLSVVGKPANTSVAGHQPEQLHSPELLSNTAFRKCSTNRSYGGSGLGRPENPFEDLEPERFTREWWEEKLAEPRTTRRLKLAGLSLALLSMLGMLRSGPEKTRIAFSSTTPEIEIRVNGERVELDHELEFPVGMEIVIESTARNHEPKTDRIAITESEEQPKVIPIELEPRRCSLRVDAGLPGAKVKLNGKDYQGNPEEFPMGSKVVIDWSAPGYESETITFVIPENARNKLVFSKFGKRATPRSVLLVTSPPGASVRIGNESKLLGKSGEAFEAQVGTYSMRLELDGYEPLDTGPIEVKPGQGTLEFGNFALKPLVRRGTLEITTDPDDAKVEIVSLDESGAEIPGMTMGDNGQVTVGSTWKVTASYAGQSQTKQIKVAEGPNRLHFELSILARLRNKVGMEFVYVPPPENDFEFGNRTKEPKSIGTLSKSGTESPIHGELREVMRNPWSPPALVVHQESIKVPRRPPFHVPPVKVRVSMGVYVGVDEVTVGDWRRVMGERPRFMNADTPDDHPVAGVQRKDVQAFLNQLARIEGLTPGTYRMMTDAEFDYLAKHGEARQELSTLAETNRRKPGPVGRNAPDKFGLRELHGNMAELVEDYYIRDYQDQFRGRTDPVQHRPSELGIARGCHFATSSAKFTSDFRMHVNENGHSRDSRVGFRVVRITGAFAASLSENEAKRTSLEDELPGSAVQ